MAEYKINTRKSFAPLYTNKEKSESEIKKTIPFTIATKIIKYLGISLPKETKDLYAENYKTLINETKRLFFEKNKTTILIILIQECGIPLHLFVSSLISFISVL